MRHIVADESVDYPIISRLRDSGVAVFSILDNAHSIPDEQVLQIAVAQNALLLTEDKDFGELVFRLKMEHRGVLLLRLDMFDTKAKANFVVPIILDRYEELLANFSVLDNQQLRIRLVRQ